MECPGKCPEAQAGRGACLIAAPSLPPGGKGAEMPVSIALARCCDVTFGPGAMAMPVGKAYFLKVLWQLRQVLWVAS